MKKMAKAMHLETTAGDLARKMTNFPIMFGILLTGFFCIASVRYASMVRAKDAKEKKTLKLRLKL